MKKQGLVTAVAVAGFLALAGAPGASAATGTFSYAGPPVPIPDAADLSGTHPGAPVSAPVTVSGLPGRLTDVDVSIDGTACTATAGATTVGLDHTFINDLEISLQSPAGTVVKIIDNTDGSGNNLCQVVLDDQSAGPSIQTAVTIQAPFTGSWQPANPLSALNGEAANGTWALIAQDFFQADTGSIRAFSITLRTGTPTAVTTTASPDTTLGAGDLTADADVTGRGRARDAATVGFALYGPDDPTCAGPAVFTSTVAEPTTDGPVTSDPYTPTAAGQYRWVASYSGDSGNDPSASACGDAVTTVAAAPARPAVVAPAITGLSVAEGPTAGGQQVTIAGANFTGASEVRFGDTPAASVRVDRYDRLVAVTPAHEAGSVAVTVRTAAGTSAPVRYVYTAPAADATPAPTSTSAANTAAGCVVPDVLSRTLVAARTRLTAAGCTLGKVKRTTARHGAPTPRVIAQGVKPGTQQAAGTPVSVTTRVHR